MVPLYSGETAGRRSACGGLARSGRRRRGRCPRRRCPRCRRAPRRGPRRCSTSTPRGAVLDGGLGELAVVGAGAEAADEGEDARYSTMEGWGSSDAGSQQCDPPALETDRGPFLYPQMLPKCRRTPSVPAPRVTKAMSDERRRCTCSTTPPPSARRCPQPGGPVRGGVAADRALLASTASRWTRSRPRPGSARAPSSGGSSPARA